MMGGSQEPRSSPGVTGPSVRPDTCPSLSWPPDIVSVQGFNYQIRSGVAHTLHTTIRADNDMSEKLKPILYEMSSIIFFTTQPISVFGLKIGLEFPVISGQKQV